MNQINKVKINRLKHQILDLQERVKEFDPTKRGEYEAVYKMMNAIKKRKYAIKLMNASNHKYTNEDLNKEFKIRT